MRWLSAGESHGPAMGIVLEGLPAGVPLSLDRINGELSRRQQGAGRGGRMAIEQDEVQVLAGLRHGVSLGSPLLLVVANRDHANWGSAMQAEPLAPGERAGEAVRIPRPGHADLPGAVKYGHRDLRNVLERASARETVNRSLAGAVALQILEPLGIQVGAFVTALGGVEASGESRPALDAPPTQWMPAVDASPVSCLDPLGETRMLERIEEARQLGDTLGGVVELRVTGLPVGLGSHVHWDRRLDGRLGAALLSLPAVKGLEVGDALTVASHSGREGLDTMLPAEPGALPRRAGGRDGGLEGGMSTGETLWLRLFMKPLSTLRRPLASVDLDTGEAVSAHRERSDVCALPALAVVAGHVAAWEMARALLESFGADQWEDVRQRVTASTLRAIRILGPASC